MGLSLHPGFSLFVGKSCEQFNSCFRLIIMSGKNNNNASSLPRKNKKKSTGGSASIKKDKKIPNLGRKPAQDVVALKKKVDNLTRNNARVSVVNGNVDISMPKSRVDGLLSALLEPEQARNIFPLNVDNVSAAQYSAAALSMRLPNGLGKDQSSLESYVAETVNPEAPLLISTLDDTLIKVDKNEWFTLESHTENAVEEPTSICATLWASDSSGVKTMMIPEPVRCPTPFKYNEIEVTGHYLYNVLSEHGGDNWGLEAIGGTEGALLFWDNDQITLRGYINFGEEQTVGSWPGDARYISFIMFGKIDLGVKVIGTEDGQGVICRGKYHLTPVTSPDYLRVATTEKKHRVVSSATCMTYAPDMQYGGGNLCSAVLECAPLRDIGTYESYLYTRRRSYLNKALTGGYNVCLARATTLKWSNTNRYNSFASDGTCLALTQITYTPSNNINMDYLNMQIKNHVWYEMSTNDMTRNPKYMLSNNSIADRVLSGISLLYRPSENLTHHEINKMFTKAWHWFNGGSDEATALRKAAATVGSSALKALPVILGAL